MPAAKIDEAVDLKHSEKAETFVGRVTSSIPIVQESVSNVQAYANSTSLGRMALNAKPPKYVQTYYESYVQPHLDRADALGCRSLDLLQEKFPAPKQQANEGLARVVDNMETILERYLPAASAEETEHSKSNGNGTTVNEKSIDSKSDNQGARVYRLLNTAATRLTKNVQSRTVSAAATNVVALQSMLSVYAEAAKQRFVMPEKTTEQIWQLTNQVTTQVYSVMDYFKQQPQSEWLKARVASLVDIAAKQIELVRSQYSRTDISAYEKARGVAQGLQDQVLPVLQTIQSQIQYYAEKTEVKRSFEYFGLMKLPTASAQ
ncbi:hypothetical protein BDB00DRAFT_895810 [Zychaea mexicana]|uniref:uncharacterized protein n=1 Tax=Zychaea mexicana TaxID=64656 RepID=UPI0022FF08A3|nr:uncharacterized protein BDB00DRAFT_895810 [Zychaea mexicana]KAI9496026.1 hypothetical protein BDB00DRAFT_895810 [Zychaea mexicana]